MTPRYLAIRALLHQEQNGYANLVLDAELKKCVPPLLPRDAAFCAQLFYTVLERRNYLDNILARYSKKALNKLDAPVLAILRAGLAQALFLRVPVSAAVNESVKLTRAFGKSSACGMVNAILRRAVEFDLQTAVFSDEVEKLSVLENLSPQIAALLFAQYGAEAFALAEAFYRREQTCIRTNTLKTSDEALQSRLERIGCEVQAGPWPHSMQTKFSGSPADVEAFRLGWFHVQGAASQLTALSLRAAPGQRVLDLCAAPGGKSLTLAQQMHNEGQLLSCDAVQSRLPLISKNFQRCGVTCAQVRQNDASVFCPELGTFDRVLCDVPCSGLGVISKKPDIRYHSMEGLPELCALQAKILEQAARYLVSGGVMVYSTCTVNRRENEEQVAAFLSDHPDFTLAEPFAAPAGAISTGQGMLLLPNRTAMDGFFIAVLERK